ncbi:NUDIX hydrolase [Amycolatopsis sp. NPDC004079]|uniref:NUDIX hydrolase n=1 Tax=Amycolatopsis sp. NPDC004079 TaxID=3154549 RepID=UPI0033BBED12
MENVRSVLRSAFLDVELADVTKPSGAREEHYLVRLPEAVMTVVLDEIGEHVLLAWRHRCVPDLWNYEVPGGLLEKGETPEEAAPREVAEETGYRVRGLRHLVTFEPAVGSLRAPHHVYAARAVERVGDPTERDEGIFDWVPLARVPQLIAEGKIGNSGTLIGLLHILATLGAEDAQSGERPERTD